MKKIYNPKPGDPISAWDKLNEIIDTVNELVERVEKLENGLCDFRTDYYSAKTLKPEHTKNPPPEPAADDAKQAITSLIKELVAEAKPAKKNQLAQSTNEDESRSRFYRIGGYNFAIDEFEQNLLKALEEL